MKEIKSPEDLKKLLNSDEPIVIFYFLRTCGHCQVMHEPYAELEKKNKKKAKFVKVESENIPEEMEKTSFPEFELREKKKVKKVAKGEMPKDQLENELFGGGLSGGRRRTRSRRLVRRTRKLLH